MQHKETPQALRFLFRMLDIQHCGYLTLFTINYFFKASAAAPSCAIRRHRLCRPSSRR
jgi:hypothetical protein